MKLLISSFLFIIITSNLSANLKGQAIIDSLISELPNFEQDTNKVNLLSILSFSLYSSNPDKGIEYGIMGVDLAKKLNWKNGLADCYNSIGVNYSYGKYNLEMAIDYYFKSLEINKEIENKNGVAGNLGNIAMIYKNQAEYDKAIEYYNNALKINKELKNKNAVANKLGNIGNIYKIKANYPEALDYYTKALNIMKDLQDKKGISDNLANIGGIYKRLSNFPKALEFYHKSLKIMEDIGNRNGIAINLGNIGIIYKNQADYPKALDYYQKALKITKESGNEKEVAGNLANIGVIYNLQLDYKKSLKHYNQSLEIFELLGDKRGIANNLINIGALYQKQSNFADALNHYHNASGILEELGDKRGLGISLGNMGELYFSLSQDSIINSIEKSTNLLSLNKKVNLNKSIELLKQSIDILESIGELFVRSSVIKTLANAYKQSSDIVNSDKYIREYMDLKDSVFNHEKAKELGYMTAERDRLVEDRKLEQEAREKAKKIAYRNNTQYLSISIFIILLGILMMLNGKIKMSEWVARGLVFITFILLFEFILVIIDPITDDYSEGEPFVKLGINLCIAFVLYPIHQLFNRKVSRILVKRGGGTTIQKIIKEFNEKKGDTSKNI